MSHPDLLSDMTCCQTCRAYAASLVPMNVAQPATDGEQP